MKEMSGIDLAKYLKEINFSINIIFVTSYSDFMSEAFHMHALGYVLKPVDEEKIRIEIENLRNPVKFSNNGIYTMQTMLIFACMNLKKLAKWKRKNGLLTPLLRWNSKFMISFCKNIMRYWKYTLSTPLLSTV